jgi:hypothetical protein
MSDFIKKDGVNYYTNKTKVQGLNKMFTSRYFSEPSPGSEHGIREWKVVPRKASLWRRIMFLIYGE